MKAEKLDMAAVNVKDLDKAIKFFSEILGTTFVNVGELKYGKTKPGEVGIEKVITDDAPDRNFEKAKIRIAMDRTGFLELVESNPPVDKEGLRNIHFKVPDIEQAMAEMKQKGIRLISYIKIGGLKEAIFHPDDVYDIRLCIVEYNAPTMVDAILQKP